MPKRRGRRGEGSVGYDRASGTWYARIYLGSVNGKRIVRKARARTEGEAQDELKRLRRAP